MPALFPPPARISRRGVLAAAMAASIGSPALAQARPPVRIGLSAAVGVPAWTAPRSIEAGIAVAIAEINAAGGVLGGRPLVLEVRDHRSSIARAQQAVHDFAAMPDLVAVFCDSYSPTALEMVPLAQEHGLPLLNPWASADAIVDQERRPGWSFRLSLRDSWAMPAIVAHAAGRGLRSLGLLAVANGWGRSNEAALRGALGAGRARLAGVEWHGPSDDAPMMATRLAALRGAGAQAVVLVAAFDDSCALFTAMGGMPAAERLPVLSHWGLTAGDVAACTAPLDTLDLRVVQTFDFGGSRHPRARAIEAAGRARLGIAAGAQLPSPAGLAHAYDLTQILARALQAAGSTDRAALRDALEQVRDVRGLVRHYPRPFAPDRHEALSPADVYLARFGPRGELRRAA
jgi:branched-chain amino acid transport system substrate-binding protein